MEASWYDIIECLSASISVAFSKVRGAYMQFEKNIAAKYGSEYPVHDTKEATDACYDRGVQCVLEELARRDHPEASGGGGVGGVGGGVGGVGGGVGGVFLGTHNSNTVQQALELMQDLGIDPGSGTVCFGQLLGMADYISYTLAESGHLVHKVLAYGEEDDVVPFLIRRAHENDRMSGLAQLEKKMYANELKRRTWFAST